MSAFTQEEIEQRLAILKQNLFALQDASLKQALTADITTYSLDTGQSKVSTTYTSPESLQKAIMLVERQINEWSAKLNGSITVLRDVSSVRIR